MDGSPADILLISEVQYLPFYRPFAQRLKELGFHPAWVAVDGLDAWPHPYVDAREVVETLVSAPQLELPGQDALDLDALSRFERRVFADPEVFRRIYAYTMEVVRTPERAPGLAMAWARLTWGLIAAYRPRAVFVWNGRYLPYRAILEACARVGQPAFTNEIGWVPGTVFVDRGPLSPDTTDLMGRNWETATPPAADLQRANAFLQAYTTQKATMVAKGDMPSPVEARQRFLGQDGKFLLFYACQVDWDTNVVIGAHRYSTNASAVEFLRKCVEAVPGGRLVVKTHPLDTVDQTETLRQVVGDRGVVVSDIHAHALIEAADAVAVRNSTVGFEALCYGKPLLLLERSKYAHAALTYQPPDVAAGRDALTRIATGSASRPHSDALRHFVLHLLDRYLVPLGYDYFFERGALSILDHFQHSQAFDRLGEVLRAPISLQRACPPDAAAVSAVHQLRWQPAIGGKRSWLETGKAALRAALSSTSSER